MKTQFLILSIILISTGCVSGPLQDARQAFYNQQPFKAAQLLDTSVGKRDRLLHYMEKGQILHYLKQYEDSSREFLQSEIVMEQQDIVNLGQQSASMLTNDWVTEYKGEYSERLWVHTYLMMNFLLTYNHEKAQVEARKAIKLFQKYPQALKSAYFTRVLVGLCFENMGMLDDAYLEYKKLAQEIKPSTPMQERLYRFAASLGFDADARKYRPKHLHKPAPAELILFAGFGNAPVKISKDIIIPPSVRFSFPSYETRKIARPKVITVADVTGTLAFETIVTDMELLAEESLKVRAAKIIAKETARAALKESMAHTTNDPWVELVVRLFLLVLEQADTRCWQTLPGAQMLVRIPLEPGKHHVLVKVHYHGSLHEIDLGPLQIKTGQRKYMSIRITD